MFNTDSGDFLERYMALSEVKRRAMNEFAEIIGFFESFYREENAPYFEKFAKETEQIRTELYEKVYSGLDYSLFRGDLDGEAAAKYLKWLFDAYTEDTTRRFQQGKIDVTDEAVLEEEWAKFYAFTDDLRKVFYKEEESNVNH
ncbi:MAG: hypothetical protein QM793_05195 [Muricomes sp.]